ncbi:hypothetical protein H6G01_09740 [Leptolyngbya sp. FACHB-17]|nr:hypothetical protein [Leptolyngbya sp. FACHB-17]
MAFLVTMCVLHTDFWQAYAAMLLASGIGPVGKVGRVLPKLLAPFPNRFVRHRDAAVQHHLLDVPVAQGEGVVEPDTVADNFTGKLMAGIHGSGIVNRVQSVRLFYLCVKLIMPRWHHLQI